MCAGCGFAPSNSTRALCGSSRVLTQLAHHDVHLSLKNMPICRDVRVRPGRERRELVQPPEAPIVWPISTSDHLSECFSVRARQRGGLGSSTRTRRAAGTPGVPGTATKRVATASADPRGVNIRRAVRGARPCGVRRPRLGLSGGRDRRFARSSRASAVGACTHNAG